MHPNRRDAEHQLAPIDAAGGVMADALQALRTKVFLALSHDFSALMAADLRGKAERLKPGYTLTEAGQDARASMLTGRPAAHRTIVSAAKTYSLMLDYVFQPKAFAELQNAQAIVPRMTGSDVRRRLGAVLAAVAQFESVELSACSRATLKDQLAGLRLAPAVAPRVAMRAGVARACPRRRQSSATSPFLPR
jgi:hypothetical protein